VKTLVSSAFAVALCLLLIQSTKIPLREINYPDHSVKSPSGSSDLFGNDEILHLKLSGNIRSLFNDRSDDAVYHPLVLSYKSADSSEININIKAKTRGNFRRKRENCIMPPILLNFSKKESVGTVFSDQDKLKLVTPCRSNNYVIREYLVYKLYNLLTPKSFRAKLTFITFYDTEKKKEITFYGILLEEDEQMAERNGSNILKNIKIQGESTETITFLKMAMFQYMIGNTDWSVPYLHNIRLVALDSISVPAAVPYDFDHAGIVDAPYALPPEQLEMTSTHERRFRGYCITDMKSLDEVVTTYNGLKSDIYKVYNSCTLIEAKYKKTTLKFLDDFFVIINDAKKLKSEFTYPCKANSTNFVIKGLKN